MPSDRIRPGPNDLARGKFYQTPFIPAKLMNGEPAAIKAYNQLLCGHFLCFISTGLSEKVIESARGKMIWPGADSIKMGRILSKWGGFYQNGIDYI